MNKDLLIIKKKYGEEMAHFCREHFAILLETEGLLSSLLLEHFDTSHELYKDLKDHNLLSDFEQYINSFIQGETEEKPKTDKTPKELLESVGYDLYECKTESDIQSFKKYYAPREELCTFGGNRLNTNYVFFAVKKDVDKIKREDFEHPERQDEYGTSVISIQFDRRTNYVSIKNRYNHTVINPDSTFGNNLDNIVNGLTDAFERIYGFKQKEIQRFEMTSYVMVNGKYYKYNYEIDNYYYCTNNIFIKYHQVITYPKERYILFDYYLLDMQEKKICCLDEELNDSFVETIGNIEKIEIKIEKEYKKIKIINDLGHIVEIIINKKNQMISYQNNDVKEIGNDFCRYNKTLSKIYVSSVEKIGEDFCYHNRTLSIFVAPQLKVIGNNFCFENQTFENLYLPNVITIGNDFCGCNRNSIRNVNLPKVQIIGYEFLEWNTSLKSFKTPCLKTLGSWFCYQNHHQLQVFEAPELENVGPNFLKYCDGIRILIIPKVTVEQNIKDLLKRKLPVDTLVLNDKFMMGNYPLTVFYKKRKLEEEAKKRKEELKLKITI